MEGTRAKRGEGAVYAAGLPLDCTLCVRLCLTHGAKISGSERRPAGGLAISWFPFASRFY